MINLEQMKQDYAKTRDPSWISVCCIEEMSEATKVLTKYLRNSHKFSVDNLTEEVAHALLLLDLIRMKFGITDEQIIEEQLKTFYRDGENYIDRPQVQR